MIGSQTLKVGTFTRHLVARAFKKKNFRRNIVAALMLTSMVDMFSLLVIFLLQSFSNSPEVMALSKGIQLPAAVSAGATLDAPVLAISREEVVFDQKLVGEPGGVLGQPKLLIEKLQTMRAQWQQAHPTDTFKGDIHLQADRELSSTLVSQFLSILISQGYSAVHLAVASGSGK
ncbi:MAG: biopolymer transporter ExbD [Bdellovibrionia bacterium]